MIKINTKKTVAAKEGKRDLRGGDAKFKVGDIVYLVVKFSGKPWTADGTQGKITKVTSRRDPSLTKVVYDVEIFDGEECLIDNCYNYNLFSTLEEAKAAANRYNSGELPD